MRLLAGVETLSIDHANSRHVAHHQWKHQHTCPNRIWSDGSRRPDSARSHQILRPPVHVGQIFSGSSRGTSLVVTVMHPLRRPPHTPCPVAPTTATTAPQWQQSSPTLSRMQRRRPSSQRELCRTQKRARAPGHPHGRISVGSVVNIRIFWFLILPSKPLVFRCH